MTLRLVRILLARLTPDTPPDRPPAAVGAPTAPTPARPEPPSLEAELVRIDGGSPSAARGEARIAREASRRPNGPALPARGPRPGRRSGHRTLHDATRRRGCQRPPDAAR